MHIAEGEDDSDYFALYGVPHTMLERFKREGGDFYYITTLEGTQVAVCDSIDFENWKIKNSWFAEISNLEFFRTKQAFLELKRMYIDEVKSNGASRALHSQLVHKHVQNELTKHYTKFDQVMNEPESSEEELTKDLITDATPSNGDSL